MQLSARPAGDYFTYEDHDLTPEGDGLRYELIGGAIVVTPSPFIPHQRVSRRLHRMLDDVVGPSWEVFAAPIDLDLPTGDRVVPDLVVARAGLSGELLELPVALVVEIVSRGSRTNDRVTKRAAYADAGIAHYCMVDLLKGEVVCLRLEDGGYAVAVAGPVVQMTDPFELTIDLQALADPAPS